LPSVFGQTLVLTGVVADGIWPVTQSTKVSRDSYGSQPASSKDIHSIRVLSFSMSTKLFIPLRYLGLYLLTYIITI